jgi:hypothetical protein
MIVVSTFCSFLKALTVVLNCCAIVGTFVGSVENGLGPIGGWLVLLSLLLLLLSVTKFLFFLQFLTFIHQQNII